MKLNKNNLNIKIVVLLSILFVASCSQTNPIPFDALPLNSEVEGIKVERRIDRHFSGRPIEVFYVTRDSAGNYLKHGRDTHYYLNSQTKFFQNYHLGTLEGLSQFWYQDGNKQGELSFSDGKPNGTAITWFKNGRKQSEKKWINGVLSGVSKDWNEQGRLIRESFWNNNKLDSSRNIN